MAYNPKIKIDLLEVFNEAFSSKPYEVRRALRSRVMQESFKSEFGARMIEFIIDRTLSGKDKDGETFTKYSKAYKKSLVFQLYKGSQSRVDLKLTGGMLASMKAEYTRTGQLITILFDDENEATKAYGHITGMSGREGGVVRDFFGITNTEAAKILKTLVKVSDEEIAQSAQIDEAVDSLEF